MQDESGFEVNEYSGALRAECLHARRGSRVVPGAAKSDCRQVCLFSLLSYLQGCHRAVGCQVQVLSQVEVISKHGEMSCQKIVVLDSLQRKPVAMRRDFIVQRLCSVGSIRLPIQLLELRLKHKVLNKQHLYCD